MPLAGLSRLELDIVMHIADILRQLESTYSEHPSRSVVAFASTCREHRGLCVPVSAGLVGNVAQYERLTRGRKAFRVVSAMTRSKEVFALLIRSWSATLQDLGLYACRDFMDVSALGLSQCSSLHTLHLVDCWAFTDVSALAHCSSLHILNLRGCDAITDVSALAQCNSLHTLDFRCCVAITDVSALAQCSSLHTLNLLCCTAITDVSALAQCSSLHTLDLAYILRC